MGTYLKATETFQYTNFSSCNPPGVKRGLIKGEALRLRLRTNSSNTIFAERITDFEKHFRKRGYPKGFIPKINKWIKTRKSNNNYKKTKKHQQHTLISELWPEQTSCFQQKQKANKGILPFVTQYKPSVPNLKQISISKWHEIENQPLLREAFKGPLLISSGEMLLKRL